MGRAMLNICIIVKIMENKYKRVVLFIQRCRRAGSAVAFSARSVSYFCMRVAKTASGIVPLILSSCKHKCRLGKPEVLNNAKQSEQTGRITHVESNLTVNE